MRATILSLLVLTLPFPAHADSLYQQRARVLQAGQQNQELARVNRYYDTVQSRFMLNLARFGQAHSGFAATPDCTDQNGASSGGWKGQRHFCDQGLCVNVLGDARDQRGELDPMILEIHRKYEMIRGCEVVLNNGYACSVAYLHSPKDAWMVGFGGTCIDGNGNARSLSVPFRNVKFD